MSHLWLNVQPSLIPIILVNMSLSSCYGCLQKETYRKKYLRAVPIYGHWHSSLGSSLTGAPCPYNSLTAVAFWQRSVSALAVGFWPGSQYQPQIPSSGAGLTFDQKVFSYPVRDSPPLSRRMHLAWLVGRVECRVHCWMRPSVTVLPSSLCSISGTVWASQ